LREKPPLESAIVKKIIAYLNSLDGCRALKRHGGRLRGGEPDIYGSYYGRHFELEVKRSDKVKITPRQASCICKWKKAGAIADVVTSIEDVMNVFQMKGFFLEKKGADTNWRKGSNANW